jgi:hypothetical protein
MTPETKAAMTKWNTEFSKMSQKMHALGINPSQTSSLTGVFGMQAATRIGGETHRFLLLLKAHTLTQALTAAINQDKTYEEEVSRNAAL